MKITHRMMYTLLGATLALAACAEDNKNLSQPKEPEKTTDLITPDDTDQIITRSVNLSTISPTATQVTIYADKSCTDASLLTELPVSEIAENVRLDIAKTDRALYIQYIISKGEGMMNISLNAVSTHAKMSVKLPGNASGFGMNGGEGTYRYQWHPARGETATLMMEDNWPEMGDHDFNDFIVWYHMQVIFFDGGNGSKDSHEADETEFEVTLRTMGGYLPYHLGLRLDQTSAKYIDGVIEINGNDLVKTELQNSGEDAPTIFIFTGTDQLQKQNNSKTSYNTEADHQIVASDLVAIKYGLKTNYFNSLERTKALWAMTISENQNFFPQKGRDGGREAYLKGYEPTTYYSGSHAGEAGNNMRSDTKYRSIDNFVWGIKVLAELVHPHEKKDVMEVYGKFRSWITNPNFSPDSPNFSENRFKYLNSSQAIK